MGRHDKDDDERRRRSRKRNDEDYSRSRKRKRDKERRHHYSDSDDDLSEESRRKHKKHRKKRYRDDRSESDDASPSTSDDSHRRRKKQKKRDRKEKKKRRKEEKKRKGSRKDHDDGMLQRSFDFADALHELLDEHPGLASELPIMLIRMAGGTSFNLGQMTNASAARGLEKVFAAMSSFGMTKDNAGWTWKAPAGTAGGSSHELLLIRIARSLLDQIGITIEAVDNFGKVKEPPIEKQTPEKTSIVATSDNDKETRPSLLQEQALNLLNQFDTKTKDDTAPSLAEELGGLCSQILNGECIAIGGLPDEHLRNAIEQIFVSSGLEKSELAGDSDDDDEEEEPTIGYGLPDRNDEDSRARLSEVIAACKHQATAGSTAPARRQIRGPLPLSMAASMPAVTVQDSEDDEDGPAPVGSEQAKRRVQVGASLPPEMLQAMADRRRKELQGLTGGVTEHDPNEREEWMLNPGEHEFLQGIKSGNVMKARNFQNKKVSESAAPEPQPVDPRVQAEVDAIIDAHKQARGLTLMEAHRANIAAEKAQAAESGVDKKGFEWSRDKDLDAGRRVDKNALKMIMGGAGSELKDKFQGGLSRGFM